MRRILTCACPLTTIMAAPLMISCTMTNWSLSGSLDAYQSHFSLPAATIMIVPVMVSCMLGNFHRAQS